MKNKLLTIVIVLLAILSLGSFTYSAEANRNISELKEIIAQLPSEPVVYVGKDGKSPVAGIDYRIPENGKNGINSISFVTTETIVKEVPLLGQTGSSAYDTWLSQGNVGTEDDFLASLRGADAPYQQIRVNPDNGNIQTKLSSWDAWSTLVKCVDYRLECPSGDSI